MCLNLIVTVTQDNEGTANSEHASSYPTSKKHAWPSQGWPCSSRHDMPCYAACSKPMRDWPLLSTAQQRLLPGGQHPTWTNIPPSTLYQHVPTIQWTGVEATPSTWNTSIGKKQGCRPLVAHRKLSAGERSTPEHPSTN